MSRLTYIPILVLLPACMGAPNVEVTSEPVLSTSCGGGICVVDPIPKADACPPGRQVGVVVPQVAACPTSTSADWSAVKLFSQTLPAPVLSPELEGYCLYKWTGLGTPDVGALPSMSGQPASDWLDPDCQVVVPLSPHPYEVLAAPKLASSFRDQVEALQAFPGEPQGEATKVVVVDTSPTTGFPDPAPGFVDHGFFIGHIIRQLGCASGLCLTQVSNQLAMGLHQASQGAPTWDSSGGTFGYQSDLAVAILEGYDRAVAASANENIIINLSLGWDPETGGGRFSGDYWTGTTDDNPAHAVYSAISQVACDGGLVIAAAGNDSGGVALGPMYPGGWEEKPAPPPWRCGSVLYRPVVSSRRAASSSYQPLLYAVGGVDGQDEPYTLSRLGGSPPLVGPSEHVVMGYPAGPSTAYTHVYSGTSVSTAVASAIAGIVWAYLPNFAPADVMQIVYDGGTGLTRGADFWLNGSPNMPQRRLSVCGAVSAACGSSPSCSVPPVCQLPMPGRDARPKGINLTGVPAKVVDASTSIYPHVRTPCEGTIYSEDPGGPGGDVYCPLRQFYANESVPWVYPQPPVHTCPTCILNVTSLYLGISNEAPTTMSEPRLTVVDKLNNTKVYELKLGSGLKPGATFKVTGLGFTGPQLKAMSKASFDVQVGTKTVDSSPILIEP